MRQSLTKITVLFAVCVTTFALAQQPDTTAVSTSVTQITVNGMVCAFCAQGIEKRLTALPQTKVVYVNLKQKLVVAEAKAGQSFDSEKLTAEIKDAGYDVVKIETAKESFTELTTRLKAK